MSWLAKYVATLVATVVSVAVLSGTWRLISGNWFNTEQLALSVALLALWGTFDRMDRP
jgi:hypothetical protein